MVEVDTRESRRLNDLRKKMTPKEVPKLTLTPRDYCTPKQEDGDANQDRD